MAISSSTHIPKVLTLRRFNNFLTVIVFGFALYIAALPFLSNLSWWVEHEAPVISKPATAHLPSPINSFPSAPTLVVPALALTEIIHEGPGEATLNQGVWHIPNTSSPTEGSNTVFAAHRHTIHGPGVFYHLDKLKIDDDIYMYWQKSRYHYTVENIEVVPPTAVEVQAASAQPRLTLYTCTPLWTFKDRLVIQASLKDKI